MISFLALFNVCFVNYLKSLHMNYYLLEYFPPSNSSLFFLSCPPCFPPIFFPASYSTVEYALLYFYSIASLNYYLETDGWIKLKSLTLIHLLLRGDHFYFMKTVSFFIPSYWDHRHLGHNRSWVQTYTLLSPEWKVCVCVSWQRYKDALFAVWLTPTKASIAVECIFLPGGVKGIFHLSLYSPFVQIIQKSACRWV